MSDDQEALGLELSLMSYRLSERDRTLGKCEAVIEALQAYVPAESPALASLARKVLGDIEKIYDADGGEE